MNNIISQNANSQELLIFLADIANIQLNYQFSTTSQWRIFVCHFQQFKRKHIFSFRFLRLSWTSAVFSGCESRYPTPHSRGRKGGVEGEKNGERREKERVGGRVGEGLPLLLHVPFHCISRNRMQIHNNLKAIKLYLLLQYILPTGVANRS